MLTKPTASSWWESNSASLHQNQGASNRPLPGTLDATQYGWMPMVASLGLGFALLRGEHIRVNLLTEPTGQRVQRIVEVLGMAFTLATVAALIWFGALRAYASTEINAYPPGAIWLPIWLFQWVVLIGLIGLLLQTFAQLYRAVVAEEFIPEDSDEALAALESEGIHLGSENSGNVGKEQQ